MKDSGQMPAGTTNERILIRRVKRIKRQKDVLTADTCLANAVMYITNLFPLWSKEEVLLCYMKEE